MEKTKMKNKEEKVSKLDGTLCKDRDCPTHGHLKVRGRTFEGTVTKIFPKRVKIEFGRMVYVRKYERYKKSRTRMHARIPNCMKENIKLGDYIKVQECRPLSKIIHFVVVSKIKNAEENKK